MAFFEMTDQSDAVRPCYAEVRRWSMKWGSRGSTRG